MPLVVKLKNITMTRQYTRVLLDVYFNACHLLSGSQGSWNWSQMTLGKRHGTSWAARQSTAALTQRQRTVHTRVATWPNVHVYGLQEETRAHRGSPHRHEENIQTSCRKALVHQWVGGDIMVSGCPSIHPSVCPFVLCCIPPRCMFGQGQGHSMTKCCWHQMHQFYLSLNCLSR